MNRLKRMAQRGNDDGIVEVGQCWGCNRLHIPKPWTPATLDLLRREGRLRVREILCGVPPCPNIAGASPQSSKPATPPAQTDRESL